MAKPDRLNRQRAVLEQYKRGGITIRQGAEQLGISYWDMNELLRENHIPLVSDLSMAVPSPGGRPARPRLP